jgi:hypothetical protein
MSLEYLPIMAQAAAPKPPRVLVSPSKQAWIPLTKPVNESKVALLSSAALRLEHQEPFLPREDLSFRRVPSDRAAGAITIDHHSGIGRVPKQDPEIVSSHRSRISGAARRDRRALAVSFLFHGRRAPCAESRRRAGTGPRC